jgi:drug/metabolite transporter (DMT)-like permease
MTWFVIALVGYFALAWVFILDKLILTKSSASKPVIYTFYSTIYMFAALAAYPLGATLLSSANDWLWALVSGLAFGFGLWTMFIAVKGGEASHINPFIGAVITVATFGMSSVLLSEALTDLQIVGMIILVFASFLLSFEKSRKNSGIHMGFLWAVFSGVFFAVSHVAAKYLYDIYPFITAFVWTRATTGFVGLFCLLFPSVRRSFKKKKSKSYAKRHTLFIIVIDKILAVIGVVAIQYSISIGSVTLVNAMSGLQYALMFVLIYLFSKFLPKVFNEYFTKKELWQETIALVLIVLGSALFVF